MTIGMGKVCAIDYHGPTAYEQPMGETGFVQCTQKIRDRSQKWTLVNTSKHPVFMPMIYSFTLISAHQSQIR